MGPASLHRHPQCHSHQWIYFRLLISFSWGAPRVSTFPSPCSIVISSEVLAANLRSHHYIVGLRLPGISLPLPILSLYADDTSGTFAFFDTYDTFERGTGSKLTLNKCEGLWLGTWRNRVDSPVAIAWTSSKIKVLGVYLGNGNLDEENWRPRIEAVKRCLKPWHFRGLSYSGKAIAINALALSRIWYVASLFFFPSWARAELNSLIFFSPGKKDLVAGRSSFILRPVGASLWYSSILKSSLFSFVQWIKRLLVSPNGLVYLFDV